MQYKELKLNCEQSFDKLYNNIHVYLNDYL